MSYIRIGIMRFMEADGLNEFGATVVILIDALGYEIVQKHGFELPIGDARRIRTVPGFSQAALLSILTALSPADHGMWLMYSFDEKRSPLRWTKVIPQSVSSERLWLRRLISWKLERIDKINSYYSLYDIPRNVLPYLDIPLRKSYFKEGAIEGIDSIFDYLSANGIPYRVWDYSIDEEQAFSELKANLERGENGFFFLYTAKLDSLLHRYGTDHETVGGKLAWYMERISQLFDRATERYKSPGFFVFGDHGMCDVSKLIDIQAEIEQLGFKVPDDYIPFYDSTMARFKVFSTGIAERLMLFLGSKEYGRIIDDEESKLIGTPEPGSPYGDIVFLVDSGSLIVPSFMSKEPIAAMHGYHPNSSCMDSAFFTNQGNVDIKSILEIAHLMLPDFSSGKEYRDGD